MVLGRSPRRGDELELGILCHEVGERPHEVEDSALRTLVLSESLVIHEEVDDLPLGSLEPAEILLGGQGPFSPAPVGEAESYVVAEGIIAQEHLEPALVLVVIQIVGTSPAHDVARAFSEHGLEAELVDLLAYAVGIDELRVAESLGRHAEIFLDRLLVPADLVLEFLLGSEGRERMVVGLAEELHLAGIGKFPETLHDLRSIAVELFERGAGNRERKLELALALRDLLEEQLVHRQVALLRHPFKDCPVGKIVIVVRILTYIEKAVQTESRRLMDLKIQAY